MVRLNEIRAGESRLRPMNRAIACMQRSRQERLHLPRTPAPSVALYRPVAWGRVSFAATPVSILGWIYDPDHSLPPGMYVDVPHLDRLLVPRR